MLRSGELSLKQAVHIDMSGTLGSGDMAFASVSAGRKVKVGV
jgi:hypothetical protein